MSATDRTVYLDMNAANKGTNTLESTPSGLNRTQIGSQGAQSNYMDGRIAEPRLWNIALAEADGDQLFAFTHPLRVRIAGGINYWPLYGVDSPEPDYGGAAANLTLVNSPTQADHVPVSIPFAYDIGFDASDAAAAPSGRIMSSLVAHGGLAAEGGVAGVGGGLAG